MPRIPLIDTDTTVPGQGGLPQSVQQVPSVPQPGIDPKLAGLVAQGFGVLGESFTQIAQLRQAQQRADAVLAGKTRLQDFVQQFNNDYAALAQDPDYTTLAQRTLQQGTLRIKELSEGLSPAASGLFREDAMQRLSIVQQHALKAESDMRQQQTGLVLTQAKAQAYQDLLNAPDEATAAEASLRYEGTIRALVGAQLLKGEKAGEELVALKNAVQSSRLDRAMSADPAATVAFLEDVNTQGQGFLAGKPIKEWIDKARAEEVHALNLGEARERTARRRLEEDQRARYGAMVGGLNLLWQRGDVAGILEWQRTLTAYQTEFRQEDLQSGLSTSTALITGLQSRAEAAIDRTERRADRAERLQEKQLLATLVPALIRGDAGESDLLAAMGSGKVDPMTTGYRLYNDLQQRKEHFAYQNVYEFKEGYEWIRKGVANIVGGLENLFSAQNTQALQRMIEASHLYMVTMQDVYMQGDTPENKADLVRRQAPILSRQILEYYAPQIQAFQQDSLAKLPFGLEAIFLSQGLEAAKIRLKMDHDLGVGPLANDRIYYDLLRNLEQRARLKWIGGQEQGPPSPILPPAAAPSLGERLRKLFEGKPPIPPAQGP